MHAGMIFQAVVRKRLRIRVDVECASEFIYSHPILGPDSLVIAISQSGETIDTLTALQTGGWVESDLLQRFFLKS